MKPALRLFPLLLISLIACAGCGGGAGGSSGKSGGTATILDSHGSVDSLDPGYWYYQTDYEELGQTTQRWLYAWKPGDTQPTPDIAQGMPQVSNGGRTLTIKLKTGIRYSAPLQHRTVKAADIKYAMERCFASSVGNGYAPAYYTGIAGAPAAPASKVPDIKGIQAPDASTLVLKLTRPVGVLADANALALPCTVPVPKDYAAKYDKGNQSTYGQHAVFTGPYMVQRYQAGQLLVLVRNPSWDKSTDFRPAYLNKIVVKNGSDPTVAARQVLQGQSFLSGDAGAPPTSILKQGLTSRRSQFQMTPSGGTHYIALNSTTKPFNDPNVRRAVAAVIDRDALRKTRGGPATGQVATHFIPPNMDGFQQAGGASGPGYDFYRNPNGNVALAKSYMKKAGFKNGTYTGGPVFAVADNGPPAKQTAEALQQQLKAIGINLTLREVPHATMLQKFCGVPKAKVAVCPSLSWGKDFSDPQSVIDPIFNGKSIVPTGNVNTAQVNEPSVNRKLDNATSITDRAQRAQVYGQLDRQLTGQAFYVPWLWDNQVSFASKNVKGVTSGFNGGAWDLTFTSLR